MRIGLGFDSHAFKPGVPLIIGGLTIDHPEGLAGHSDGDVLLHAITDALLGAVSAGDIGTFFPPTDPKWKGADSSVFLKTALEEVATRRLQDRQHRLRPRHAPPQDRSHRRRDARARRRPARHRRQASQHQGQDPRRPHPGRHRRSPRRRPARIHRPAQRAQKLTLHADAPDEDDIDAALAAVAKPRDITALGRKLPTFDTDDLT